MSEQHAVGTNVESYCPKCKMIRDHAIMAMEADTIAQVTCHTCGSTHKFKHPSKAPKTRSVRAQKEDNMRLATAALWEARLANAKGPEHLYATTATYRIGDIVVHEQFGKGVVLKLSTNKCNVLFQDKERLMASAN